MSFTVNINTDSLFPIIILTDNSNKTFVEIYAQGASLNGFTVIQKNGEAQNLIDGYSSPQDIIENGKWFKGSKLNPFVCRLAKGEFVHNNTLYKINKCFSGEEALHGLLFDCVFTIESTGHTNEYVYTNLFFDYTKKNEGFPFEYSCRISYKLYADNLISIETIITNLGNQSMPMSDGWHPYFSLGNTVNDLEILFNSSSIIEFNDKLLPTGKTLADKRFESSVLLGDISLDNCFVLKDFAKPACILKNNATGISLEIIADKSYPFLQVFTPDHRKSIAIENLSSPPDSFNNKMNLDILKPGQEKKFSVWYKISA